MEKSRFLLIFFSVFLLSCHSNLTSDSLVSNSTDSFSFKIIPGKAKTPSSIMPAGFGPIRGPSISSPGIENSFSQDLIRCRKNLLNQQLHFMLNFLIGRIMKKAVALISGGLDSMLAARVIQKQGVYVEGINFYTGFCVEGHTQAIRNSPNSKLKRNNALWAAEQLGIKLHIIDIIQDYKKIVLNPKHGYGSHLNPCLDCKIFMVNRAKQWMEENQFDFIITGEVIGQRPKSQLKRNMPVVAHESKANDILLRPLCAKLLAPTLVEREGWVDREKLHGFSGRSRGPQFDLAKKFDFQEYAQPAGGCCFLTNGHYSKKLKDLWKHRGKKDYEFDDIILLKVGRHIRPNPDFKLIIGRDEGENHFLESYQHQYTSIKPISHLGPLSLIDGKINEEYIPYAAKIVARFTDAKSNDKVTLEIRSLNGSVQVVKIFPFTADQIPKGWYISG